MKQIYKANTAALQRQVDKLSTQILTSWRLSFESLLECGHCLFQLRKILPRHQYVEHLRSKFSMSEVHSHRLIALYSRFKNRESKRLLGAKPSVLYLLATTDDLAKVEKLAAGSKIKINGRMKGIDELTVKEAAQLKSSKHEHKFQSFSDAELDQRRSENIHRELSTLLLKFEDVANDIARYKSEGRPLSESKRVKKYVEEVILCLRQAHKSL
jgi:hypothetical protein